MITFSSIPVNPHKRGGRRLLSNPQAMHAAVRACFPPDLAEHDARVLWRVDRFGEAFTLYIVGPEAPDLDVVGDQAGWPSRPGRTADYGPLLDSLRPGLERSFRLTANPVRSLPAAGGRRGKVVPHVTVAQQQEWLMDKAVSCGFELRTMPPSGDDGSGAELPDLAVTRREDLSFSRRHGNGERTGTVSLRTATFDGSLRVTDADALRRALTHGIGRARAYGCGLLTLAHTSR